MIAIGKKAPAFIGINQKGESISLKDLLGSKVVLYFYPKDDTPGCTAQACNLKDNYKKLIKQGYVVLGVSTDSVASHQAFIKKYKLPFSLIADEKLVINNKYGVWGQKKMFGKTYMGTIRTTFVIDENGKIEDIIKAVDTENHTAQILNKI
jgi:peroxiredoxin Q/BCP